MPADPVPWAGAVLLALAAVMLIEAVRAVLAPPTPPGHTPEPAAWAATGAA
jgi:hypothetical protein